MNALPPPSRAVGLSLPALAGALLHAPAHAALRLQQDTAGDALLLRAFVALVIAGCAAVALAYGLKHAMARGWLPAKRAASRLERIETLRLTARSTLFVVRYGNEELLVADGEHGPGVLSAKPWPSGETKA